MPHLTPIIPEYITVHLGAPNAAAPNVRVPFIDYIKNVASTEVYPTWPDSALRANIYAQVSFALNRIFTEHYRSRGYNFDITNNTAYDQAYIHGREIYRNIGILVDELFNDYVIRAGQVQPYFTQYCDGIQTTCAGMSQWGTVPLANQGFVPYSILQNYYGKNIGIVRDAPIRSNIESYPGIALRLGSWGNDVVTIQRQLNRIADNYPAIPRIPVGIGVFDGATRSAVLKFQEVFNLPVDGIVGKGTWYKIKMIYNAVTGVGELGSSGIPLQDVEQLFQRALRVGDRGLFAQVAQFYLNYLSRFNRNLQPVVVDGIYGYRTANAVRAFQREYGLTVDGILGRNTWNKLQQVYLDVVRNLPPSAQAYPGYFVTTGSPAPIVRQLQTYLRKIAQTDRSIPVVAVDGVYGPGVKNAVLQFQRQVGIEPSGYVGPLTWTAIVERYNAYT